METLEHIHEDLCELLPRLSVRDRHRLSARLESLWPPRVAAAVRPKLLRLRSEARRAEEACLARRKRLPSCRYPEELPITAERARITDLIRDHPVVVVAGETGSGKSTQIPKMCIDAGLGAAGRIGCTQPRRIAAQSVSQRIAEELGVAWGSEVGAKIRFTDKTTDHTVIKMMTDGILLAEIQGDPLLLEYEIIVVDEAHERSVNIDLLIGYLRKLQAGPRPDLKVVITSATIDTAAFSEAFGQAPVVQVGGRLFPVELRYAPLEEVLEEADEFSYVEGVAWAVHSILKDSMSGDVLVFLPTEKDIRESTELLKGRHLGRADILPLFGRLANEDQMRIFSPSGQRRRVILATNIAETSLTIPGIRFVVDTGLSRVSRYSAHTRTQRLPIEEISQSSADQRMGRAGRLADGVCIRLYSEKEYQARPQFTQPEILRANLAEVILRMLAYKVGDIDSFPFLEPPPERSVRAGYQMLQDLGAVDDAGALTEVGDQLARLPCDPTIGRMLLRAIDEGAIREVLVIASALSVQDPRERPLDNPAGADEMHRKFINKESDFLTLLNIWNAWHDELERMSQAQVRRFCRTHFLSYRRMREWRDIYTQLLRILEERNGFRLNAAEAEYDAIHRCVLAGLPGNIAQKSEGNEYKATHNRRVMIHPGSALFDKSFGKKAKDGSRPTTPAAKRGKGPEWILCGEWVETTRLFARVVARIDPRWVVQVASHLFRYSYTDPVYEENGERVLVKERGRLYGLEVSVRKVGFARIRPKEATEIFIRSALVDGQMRSYFPFFEHNRRMREWAEDLQTRKRASAAWVLDERVFSFYDERLEDVGSVADLNRFIRDHHGGDQGFLYMAETDLLESGEDALEGTHFPDEVDIGGRKLPLSYAYKPGEEEDGATLRLPLSEVGSLDSEQLDWLVPGWLEERVQYLLKGLPKELRKKLIPLKDSAKVLVEAMSPGEGSVQDQLTRLIAKQYGIKVWPGAWQGESVPDYLIPRLEVVDRDNNILVSGRDPGKVREALSERIASSSQDDRDRRRKDIWQAAMKKWERYQGREWCWPDCPEVLEIGTVAGVPVLACPGLEIRGAEVGLKLYRTVEEAHRPTKDAWVGLAEAAVGRELGWTQRDFEKEARRLNLYMGFYGGKDALMEDAWSRLRQTVFAIDRVLPLERGRYDQWLAGVRERLRGLGIRAVDLLAAIFEQAFASRDRVAGIPELRTEWESLMHARFLRETPFEQWKELPRYFQALEKRAERRAVDRRRDEQRAAQVEPYRKALLSAVDADRKTELRWLLEEFKVSVFAQELGTSRKVSKKVMDQAFGIGRDEIAVIQDVSAQKRPADSKATGNAAAQRKARPAQKEELEQLKRLFK